jgi:hypothetical protein
MKHLTRLALVATLIVCGVLGACSDSSPDLPLAPTSAPSFDGSVQQDSVIIQPMNADSTCRNGGTLGGGGRACDPV